MEVRLNELALKFQEATNVRIADTTQRAIRENIALHSELDTTLKSCQDLENQIEICKEKEQNARLRAELFEKEAQMALNKVLQQNSIIETLAEEHIDASRARSNYRHMETYAAQKEEIIKNNEQHYNDAQIKSEILAKNIREAEETEKNISAQVQQNQRKIIQLNEILDNIKKLISKLSIKSNAVETKVCACDPNFREKLLEILEILDTNKIEIA